MADTFVSGLGANRFDGAGGVDVLSYAASTAGVSVNISNNVVSGGYAQGDVVSNFEKVVGSAFNDTLGSSTSGHTLEGGAGDDTDIIGLAGVTVTEAGGGGDNTVQTNLAAYTLGGNLERLTYIGSAVFSVTGNAEANIITGGATSDTLSGLGGDDTLIGGIGSDILIGGAGADVLDGGANNDTASYSTATGAITINTATGVHTGDAAGDTFIAIETILGSGYGDTFVSGSKADRSDGGNGVDVVNYAGSSAGVSVNLSNGVASGGDAQGDSVANIEKVVGSAFNDTLGSSTSGHVLEGGAGDDVYVVASAGVVVTEVAEGGDDTVQTALTAYTLAANVERLTFTGTVAFTGAGNAEANVITGGVGADTLSGAGTDTVRYATAVTVNLATGAHTGDAAGDTYDGVEIIQGSSSADLFVGSELADRLDGAGGTDTLSYAASILGVNVNITTNVVSGGSAEGDVIGNFESVTGSDHEDVLGSSTSAHVLAGGLGDDTYVVGSSGVIVQEAVDGGSARA